MGKPTGFMEYAREDAPASSPKARIQNYNEFHEELSETERKQQAARCMDCGVPFCQYGKMISGMASGCPLNNLIPEWNDLLYTPGVYGKSLSGTMRGSMHMQLKWKASYNKGERAVHH